MRKHIFMQSELAAKKAGGGKKSDYFEIGGRKYRVGGQDHEELIREAIRQKILQNPRAADALRRSEGTITHKVGGHAKPIFKMEKMLMAVRRELFGH